MRDTIINAIAQLDDKHQLICELCWLHDLTHKEIAQVLDVTPSCVSYHKRKALIQLQEILGKKFVEDMIWKSKLGRHKAA